MMEKAQSITEDAIMVESKTLAGKEASGVIGALKVLPRALSNINWIELLLALGTIIIIYGFKRITKKIPSTLVALLVMTGIADLSGIAYRPVEEIPSGLPIPRLEIFTQFDLSMVTPYIFTALTLALLGAIDSLLTSVVADNMTKTKHNPNKELVGQGIGNSIAAIFGGIPGAGATIRTVVNINAGGKTRLSGMIAALLLFLTLLLLGPVASRIPSAVLAGILITVGISVMDYRGLRAIPNMPKQEVAIFIVVLVLSSLWNLVYAVGFGLVIASLIFMKRIGDLTVQESVVQPLKDLSWPKEKALNLPPEMLDKVYIKELYGPLFFGSTENFQALNKQIPETAETIVYRLNRVPYMDQTGLYAMEDILVDLVKKGKHVILVGLNEQPKYLMKRIDIIPDLIPESQLVAQHEDCVEALKKHLKIQ